MTRLQQVKNEKAHASTEAARLFESGDVKSAMAYMRHYKELTKEEFALSV